MSTTTFTERILNFLDARELCGNCYGYGEIPEDLPEGDYVMVFCNCRAGRKAAELEAR